MLTHPVYRALPSVASVLLPARPSLVRETTQVTPPKPRLLDRVRAALRARHYSRRTEEAYVAWIKRYVFFFHAKHHPAEMGAEEVTRFLSSLAVEDVPVLRVAGMSFPPNVIVAGVLLLPTGCRLLAGPQGSAAIRK